MEMRISTESLLSTLGDPRSDRVDKGGQLLRFLTAFSAAFTNSIDGSADGGGGGGSEHMELSGGAMICQIFHSTFGNTLRSMHALDGR
jgi:hypothetical protein